MKLKYEGDHDIKFNRFDYALLGVFIGLVLIKGFIFSLTLFFAAIVCSLIFRTVYRYLFNV